MSLFGKFVYYLNKSRDKRLDLKDNLKDELIQDEVENDGIIINSAEELKDYFNSENNNTMEKKENDVPLIKINMNYKLPNLSELDLRKKLKIILVKANKKNYLVI